VKKNRENIKFWRSIAEQDLYEMLMNMGNTAQRIDQFQKSRLFQSVLIGVTLLLLGYFVWNWLYLAAIILPLLFYRKKYDGIKSMYQVWMFHRHLQFSKFMRLLIPYLKQSKGQTSLYTIFNKILQRTEKQEDKNSLYKLMTEMSNNPSSVKPFIDFAKRSSGTDMSIIFMSAIFDFQQTSFDTSVIDELGKIASGELMTGIDEIIEYKLRRFVFFPTKVVMCSFLIVIGFTIAVLLYNLPSMQF
jgi:hypothetical protein